MFAVAQCQEFAQETHLVYATRHRVRALAPGTGPAGFADGNLLAWEGGFQPMIDVAYVGHGAIDAGGHILPIGQQMDQHHIHVRRHFGELQPEFPYIGIGHGLLYRVAHLFDIRDQFGRR